MAFPAGMASHHPGARTVTVPGLWLQTARRKQEWWTCRVRRPRTSNSGGPLAAQSACRMGNASGSRPDVGQRPADVRAHVMTVSGTRTRPPPAAVTGAWQGVRAPWHPRRLWRKRSNSASPAFASACTTHRRSSAVTTCPPGVGARRWSGRSVAHSVPSGLTPIERARLDSRAPSCAQPTCTGAPAPVTSRPWFSVVR